MEPGGFFGSLARLLIVAGLLILAVGVLLFFAPKVPWLGHLPGDILVRRGRFTFYFPLVTGLVLSAVLTVLARIFFR